jgi:hypothetical protein
VFNRFSGAIDSDALTECLGAACDNGNPEVVTLCIDRGAYSNDMTLLRAVNGRNLGCVQALLDARVPARVEHRVRAAKLGLREILQALMRGADFLEGRALLALIRSGSDLDGFLGNCRVPRRPLAERATSQRSGRLSLSLVIVGRRSRSQQQRLDTPIVPR